MSRLNVKNVKVVKYQNKVYVAIMTNFMIINRQIVNTTVETLIQQIKGVNYTILVDVKNVKINIRSQLQIQ